jgi:hypothetical protein
MKSRDPSGPAKYALGAGAFAALRALEDDFAGSGKVPGAAREACEARLAAARASVCVTPRAGAREALLSALDSGERFRPFLEDIVRFCDLPAARVRELLSRIDVPHAWETGPLPGLAYMPFAAGPCAVAPDTGFARLPRGLCFPYHRHLGPEINYVLEGAVRDGDGTLYLPGEAIVKARGSAHECFVPDDADALIVVVQVGYEVVDKP